MSVINSNLVASENRRYVTGTVISSGQKNQNGTTYLSKGFRDQGTQIPFLIEHKPNLPIGKIIRISVNGDRVLFTAEIMNSGQHPAAQDVWSRIVAQDISKVSVGAHFLQAPANDLVVKLWAINEISVVGNPADQGALIEKVYEKLPYVSLRGPAEITHWERGHPR